jgi:3-oxoacyl-[acyl-carrier protein] reductase
VNFGILEGKVVVVTGAGSGMGSSFARRCAEEGARVVLTDVDEASVGRVAADIGGEAMVFDVTNSSAFTDAIERVVVRYGRIDGLVNNAGIAPVRDPERTKTAIANQMLRMEGRLEELTPTDDTVDLTDEEWHRMIAVHLNGTFFGTRAALSHMTRARSGSIVNISSILALRPSAGAPHYSAAKAAIIALTKSVAHEVAPFAVRVNVVCPGWVDTPLLEPFEDTVKAAIRMQIPLGRMATPAELSEMIVFLLGPQSTYCVGDVFPVTGGWV